MSAVNGFDNIAPFYDLLHRLVFGDVIDESQISFFGSIGRGSKVLMIGGGTGKALEALLATRRCTVWYVEASSAMIQRAKRRVAVGASNVTFIHGLEDSIPANVVFDAVITGFFLDLFPNDKVGRIAGKIGRHLARDGVWVITDFVARGKWWERLLLWTMYRFFVMTCKIEARRLPQWEHQLYCEGFCEKQSKEYLNGFIKSSIWSRSSG